jgi:hypothetical protein
MVVASLERCAAKKKHQLSVPGGEGTSERVAEVPF